MLKRDSNMCVKCTRTTLSHSHDNKFNEVYFPMIVFILQFVCISI